MEAISPRFPKFSGGLASVEPLKLGQLRCLTSKPGAVPMDFAAKINVVAAYTAFAFVCAIVFGMV